MLQVRETERTPTHGHANEYTGLGVLFAKLQQGVQENEQILTLARLRAEAEDIYGARLGDIEAATSGIPGGFSRDDGASVKKVRMLRSVQVGMQC